MNMINERITSSQIKLFWKGKNYCKYDNYRMGIYIHVYIYIHTNVYYMQKHLVILFHKSTCMSLAINYNLTFKSTVYMPLSRLFLQYLHILSVSISIMWETIQITGMNSEYWNNI